MRDVERNPKAVWEAMQKGNRRFIEDAQQRPNQDQSRRSQLREGQNPRAVVLACSDSRVPVEIVFDVGLGDLFVIRTAGEIIDLSVLASLEYAVESLGVELVVVMGHESCGAVKATADALDGGTIPDGFQRVLIEKVSPSILVSKAENRNTVSDFERQHIIETVDQVISRSPELKAHLDNGTVGVVGLRYRLSDGLAEPVCTFGVSDEDTNGVGTS